jgi:transposase-like protein
MVREALTSRQNPHCTTGCKSMMKPMCPKCGSDMTLAAAMCRLDVPTERKTFCCEPCKYVFTEVVSSSALVERAMLLDLQVGVHFGAIH